MEQNKMKGWTLALSDNLLGESFFKLKLLLRGGERLSSFVNCQVSFIDEAEAIAAIEYALYRKGLK
jgi:hypothetical protein